MLLDVIWSLCTPGRNSGWWIFGALSVAIICQDVFNASWIWWHRPRKISILGPSLQFGKWWSSFKFIKNGPELITEGYLQSSGMPFAIPAREGYLVFVTSEEHIKEVENSPIDQLSFHQAMEDRLKVKYTFNGFEMGPIDPHDAVPIRVLKTLLRIDIPQLRPKFQQAIEQTFRSCINDTQNPSSDWKCINMYHFAEEISLRINCKVIFGEDLANNPDFFQAAQKYHRQAVVAMLTSHYLPRWTDRYTLPSMLAVGGAMKKLDIYLTQAVNQRLNDMKEGKSEIPQDGITWVINASTTKGQKTTKRIVQQVFAIFFASAHQLPMLLMFSTYRLCEHPEYIKPLVAEAEAMMKLPEADRYKRLPLMESFLREAARHDPLDSLSVQRKVLKDFTFSDGSTVPAGNVICVPQQAVMRDPKYYDRPDDFLPFRFANNANVDTGEITNDSEDRSTMRKFTDLQPNFFLWGAAKKPCPGRWYASAVLQQFFVHLLTKYNFKLANPEAKMTLTYTTIVLPRPGLQILVQER